MFIHQSYEGKISEAEQKNVYGCVLAGILVVVEIRKNLIAGFIVRSFVTLKAEPLEGPALQDIE
jgi:hypothetical protein